MEQAGEGSAQNCYKLIVKKLSKERSMSINYTKELWNELKNTVIYKGHFKLTSGNHSDLYFNKDLLWIYTRLREKIIVELRNLLLERYPNILKNHVIFTGPATAGSLWACSVSRAFGFPFIYCEKDENEEMVFRRGFENYIKERPFIIIEDVITTEKSLRTTINAIHRHGGHVINYFCIWDRRGGNCNSIFKEKAYDYNPDNCLLCEQKIPLTSFK